MEDCRETRRFLVLNINLDLDVDLECACSDQRVIRHMMFMEGLPRIKLSTSRLRSKSKSRLHEYAFRDSPPCAEAHPRA
jgi:hypothetical protein